MQYHFSEKLLCREWGTQWSIIEHTGDLMLEVAEEPLLQGNL